MTGLQNLRADRFIRIHPVQESPPPVTAIKSIWFGRARIENPVLLIRDFWPGDMCMPHQPDIYSGLLKFRHLHGKILPVKIGRDRSEEHTSELQSRGHLVCRLLLE